MKKKSVFSLMTMLVALCFFLVSTGEAQQNSKDLSPGKFKGDGTIGGKFPLKNIKSWQFQVVDPVTGTVEWQVPEDPVVLLNNVNQLSSFASSPTNGQSNYQMAPGKTYIVDIPAIYKTWQALAGDPTGTTVFGSSGGITLFGIDAATYGNSPAYDNTVIIASTGTAGAISGATYVWVAPYPGAGATQYGVTHATSTIKPQSLHTEYTTNGTTSTDTVASGATYWELNKQGESAVFGYAKLSGASMFVKSKHVKN